MKTLLSLAAAFGVWFGPAAYFECMWLMLLTWIPATVAFIILETETESDSHCTHKWDDGVYRIRGENVVTVFTCKKCKENKITQI